MAFAFFVKGKVFEARHENHEGHTWYGEGDGQLKV